MERSAGNSEVLDCTTAVAPVAEDIPEVGLAYRNSAEEDPRTSVEEGPRSSVEEDLHNSEVEGLIDSSLAVPLRPEER